MKRKMGVTESIQSHFLRRSRPDTYSATLVSKDLSEMRVGVLQLRVLALVQGVSHSDHDNISQLQILGIRLWKQLLLGQVFVQALTNAAVGSVRTHENVAVVVGSIIASNHDSECVLFSGEDLFVHENLFGWDLGDQDVVQLRSGKHKGWVSCAVSAHKRGCCQCSFKPKTRENIIARFGQGVLHSLVFGTAYTSDTLHSTVEQVQGCARL